MNFDFVFSRKILFFIVILTGLVAFFHRLDEAPLSGDGIGYGQIAKEMTLTGDWATPYHDGVPSFYTSKPPLVYWLMAASGSILGFDNFSVKLPTALLSLLSLVVLFLFLSKYYNPNIAFFSSIILIFTQQYLHHARSVITDGPLAAFFIFAFVSFWIARTEDKSSLYYLMSVFIGLAVMTKQVFGLFIGMIIFCYIILARDWKILKNIHFWLSFLLIPVIVLPWHIAMYKKFGMKFINEYFLSTVSNVNGWNGQKYSIFYEWYVYSQILVNNYWPWLPFLLYGFYRKIRNMVEKLKPAAQPDTAPEHDMTKTARTLNCRDDKSFDNEQARDIFILCWIFVPLFVLQMMTKKNGNYLNILYPAFAVVCAEVFNSFSQKTVQKIIKIFIVVSTAASLLFISFPVVPKTIDAQKLTDPVKLIPTIKYVLKPDKKIVIRETDWFVFSSMFLFYADRGNITLSDEDFEKKILSGEKNYFASYKDDFMNGLLNKYNDKITVWQITDKTILFEN